jgi:hypothetical protein
MPAHRTAGHPAPHGRPQPPAITTGQVLRACRVRNTESTRTINGDTETAAQLAALLSGTLQAAGNRVDFLLGMAEKSLALAGLASPNSPTARVSLTSAQVLLQTLSLLKLGTAMTPGLVMASVGATFAKKVALLFGLIEHERGARVLAAAADLAAAGTFTVIAVKTAGPLIVAAALLQLAASMHGALALREPTDDPVCAPPAPATPLR